MTWKIRHQGSPRSIEGLTLPQVLEGLQDGLWEPTDEVMGPQDRQWVAIENHPQLAEVAADIEPPPPRPYDDETRLDMTPLIDVTLVLLIFFILLISYDTLQKALRAGEPTGGKVKTVSQAEADHTMIIVKVRPGPGGDPKIEVDGEPTEQNDLQHKLRERVQDTRKTILLIDATGVKEKTVVAIEGAAAGTGIEKRMYKRQAPAQPEPAPPEGQ
jgi:biopolymer transport protein ExbD